MQNQSRYSRFEKAYSRFCAAACLHVRCWPHGLSLVRCLGSRHLAAGHQHESTIISFVMVFLIQNTQNRDTEAIQIKLDELIRATRGAHNALLDLEDLEDKNLDAFRSRYRALAAAARANLDLGNRTRARLSHEFEVRV